MSGSTPQTPDLITLACSKFDRLSESELKILSTATSGGFGFCGPSARGDDPRNDPAQAAEWGEKRTIRAALIRWLCVDRVAKDLVDPHGIWIHAARIVDLLDLAFVSVPFPLVFDNCLFATAIILLDAKLETLYLRASRTAAVLAVGLMVRSDLLLQNGNAEGEVRLTGAAIGGNLGCNKGMFKNAGGIALNANGIKVTGSVFLRDGFRVEGEMQLVGADIGGNLECNTGTFDNAGGVALSADGINVTGAVFLGDGSSVDGEVRLVRANISGPFGCVGARFAPDSMLNAEQASVTGSFFWRNVLLNLESERDAEPDSRVKLGLPVRLNLQHTTVGPMADDKNSWPSIGRLHLDGFVYTRIAAEPTDAKGRLEWLRRQGDGFWPQPYRQLARVLGEAGDDSGAKRVLIAMENSRLKDGKLSWWSRAWAWALRLTIGYGYQPFRAGWWVALFVLIGFFLFCWGQDAGVLTQIPDQDATAYQPFNGFVYSLETFLPL